VKKPESLKKADIIKRIFQQKLPTESYHEKGLAFAPTNIALCKYWGKRNAELNLPMTSSLSIALPEKGAMTSIVFQDKPYDTVILNDEVLAADSGFVQRCVQFLDLFRLEKKWYVKIDIKMNIPVASGLASSACGFASLVLALKDLFNWQLSNRDLSILSRLGSGSAARSLWMGFVEWHAGLTKDGMDCFATPLEIEWPELYIGILALTDKEKKISSREAMQRTVDGSILYNSWPKKVARDLVIIRQALNVKNFALLGGTAESNALTMHATMLSCWPPICYSLPETLAAMQKIWVLRQEGLEVYFTQDAGPHLKLIFLEKDKEQVKTQFPQVEIIRLFD
jgi:diphosphomevalonate decarboxylase